MTGRALPRGSDKGWGRGVILGGGLSTRNRRRKRLPAPRRRRTFGFSRCPPRPRACQATDRFAPFGIVPWYGG